LEKLVDERAIRLFFDLFLGGSKQKPEADGESAAKGAGDVLMAISQYYSYNCGSFYYY
jgi:hypothetical protein